MITKIILILLLLIILLYFIIQGLRCIILNKRCLSRLNKYNPKFIKLSYGNMTYVDKGQGITILSVHGIFGGYDQAYDICEELSNNYRIIAPSRFGYLGSDTCISNNPIEQAKAFVELLDLLQIHKVFVLGTSAGGSVAIRFALNYPERTLGLILYSSAMPLVFKPKNVLKYAGPPKPFCSNYLMFLISPLFKPIMGMPSSTIYTMMPINKRKQGVIIDSSITNLDMANNYDEYVIEDIKCPTLIFHAKDDRLASYKDVLNVYNRFKSVTFISFDNGGHLIEGHSIKINKSINDFINQNK